MPRGDDLAANGLLGYETCAGCGHFHPSLLLRRLGGRCWDCIAADLGRLEADRVRLNGRVVKIRAKSHVKDGRGSRETDKLASKARMNALKRLRDLFPDLYGALLCEERGKLGLERVAMVPSVRPIDGRGLEHDLEAAKRSMTAE